ncbi:phosphonate transport system permease protein [Evansella vedderi]|uniref:Phosphonate transport system permease protein n=1 Tax=Evansella vedderi TaxID=38282 RepID=A0ABU0A5V8_9BACI|nr:phosphonate ABC transporter, permease protein PhnE [Evansella vedderi]MDQ0257725.1 phosphonate transport system permease protein [Evansella vedderi]
MSMSTEKPLNQTNKNTIYIPPKRSFSHYVKLLLIVGVVFLLHYWSVRGIEVNPDRISFERTLDFLSRTFPPNWEVTQTVMGAALETLQIAIIGTTGGAILSIPFGFLAASNIVHPTVRVCVRTLLNTIRSIPLILYALFFVVAVGLGPLAGTLATVIYSVGMLGKFYSEAIEAIDPKPVEGILSTGASKLKALRYGIIPQVLPHFIAYTFYRFELNFREATILGLVGAGGIGFYITLYMRSFEYTRLATVTFIILVMVVVIDMLSSYLRKKIT